MVGPFASAHARAQAEPFRALSANERQLIGLIRRDAPLSRAELARRTGLALPTISRLADNLLRDGLIGAEEKVMMTRMGQPSLPLVIAPHAAFAFGIAVRADMLTVSLAHLSGMIVASIAEPHLGATRQDTVERISNLIVKLIESNDVPAARVCGLGVGISGFFVEHPMRINAPLGMEDWATSDLECDLGRAFGLPVLIENDGNAAALGEYLYGRGNEYPSLAYLFIDRGLGGGVVLDGKLMRGRRGNAGEWTGALHPDMRQDRPTLRTLLAMLETAGEYYDSIEDMVRRVDPASPAVSAWIERTLPTANAIISAIGAILDPDTIIIGGRLPKPIAQRLIERLEFYSVPVRGTDRAFPKLTTASASGDAVSLGASALCFQRAFF